MTVPLIVLAALSALGGLMLLDDWIVDFLEPVTGTAVHAEPPHTRLGRVTSWSLAVVAVGVGIAWFLVGSATSRATPRPTSRSPPAPRGPTSTATRSTTPSWSAPGAVLVRDLRPSTSTVSTASSRADRGASAGSA